MVRNRATVVTIEGDNRVLLVTDNGSHRFFLPGGGIRRGESAIAAAERHLYQKTGLQCSKIEWHFEHKTRYNRHKVFLVVPKGQVRLSRGVLGRHIWWDGRNSIRFRESAIDILRRVGWLNWEDIGPMNGHRTWRQLDPPHRITGLNYEVISSFREATS